MISSFRNLAKSWLAPILIGLIAVSFVIVGTVDQFVGGASGPVTKAGSRTVSQAEFRQIVDNELNNYRQESGQNVTIQDLVAQGGHLQLLEGLTRREGLLAWAWRTGVRPGAQAIARQIRQFPGFFNQITGEFDQAQYVQLLAQQNVTEAQFERDIRDQIASTHFGSAIFTGLRAPKVYGALYAAQGLHTRDGRWFVVTQDMAGRAEPPTEEQLTAFMNENADRLRQPEFRVVSLVTFSPAPDAAPPAVTEEAIRERFEFRREGLSQPETRTFVTLASADAEVAARMAAALREGQSVEAVAEANDIDPVRHDARPRSAITDAAVAEAAFSLQPGQVSDPVRGVLGHTVIQLTSVAPGREATLENTREAIVEELRGEAVLSQIYARVEAYERARQDGATMEDAARTVGARMVTLPPFTEQGLRPDGQRLNAPPQVLTGAYALEHGGESDVIDAGQGQYFVLRLDQILPSALPTLDEVRPMLTASWLQRENGRLLSARADELAARVRGGEDIAEVARSANAPLIARTGVQQTQEVNAELGEGVLQGLFSQGVDQVFTGPGAQGFIVGRVDRVRPPVAALAAPLAEQLRPQVTRQITENLSGEVQSAAARSVNVRNWPDRALTALGIDEAALPDEPAE